MTPRTLAEITPAWLTEALSTTVELGGSRVVSVARVPLDSHSGLMSQMARLELAYDKRAPDAPMSVVAKLAPMDPEQRSTGLELGFFESEVRFYNLLAQRTDIRAPRCYFAHFAEGDGSFLTVLEDLSGARLGDIGRGCAPEEAFGVVRALAGLHSSWWKDPELDRLPWLWTHRRRLESQLALIGQAWPTFSARFAEWLDKAELEFLAEAGNCVTRSLDVIADGAATLLHGDAELDNMFFDDAGAVTMLDWGLVTHGPAMFDVSYFLGLSLEPAERAHAESELLRAYIDELGAHGIEPYHFDRCMMDYRMQLAATLPRLVVAGGFASFDDHRTLEEYATGLCRVIAAAHEHAVLSMLA